MVLALSLACSDGPWKGLPESEIAAWEALRGSTITLEGRVVDAGGEPLSGARVGLRDSSVRTGDDGSFELGGLTRENALVSLSLEGFHDEEAPVHLVRELAVSRVDLGDVPMSEDDPDVVRMLFTGDVIFGRRFVDLDESSAFDEVPPDDPAALISASDPYPGTLRVFTWVEPWLDGYDYVSVNLESVVTDDPATPHPTKPYVFFTFPESLDALAEHADFANLGNNHVYDYLEPGIQDTIDHVAASGMDYAGLGADADEAFVASDFDLGSQRFAMLSMTSVTGSQYEIGFVASDTRGGAADLTDDERVLGAIEDAWTVGRAPIVQAHFGKEYSDAPSDYTVGRLELLGEAQPALVVGHHPHTPHGFGWHEGVLAAHSLGNFIFDQDRVETMLGLLFEVELEDTLPVAARVRPIYLEDYRPRPLTGRLSDWLLRKVGQVSLPFGGVLTQAAGSAHVDFGAGAVEERRNLQLDLHVGATGVAIVDLRSELEPGESVVYLHSDGVGVVGRMGLDQLMFGSFEDYDVDEDCLELSRWDLAGDSQFVCVEQPYRGVAAVCSLRDRYNSEDSRVWFRNRVRVVGDAIGEPNKDMTLFGYRRGAEAGPTFFEAEYQASEGDRSFGTDVLARREAGTYDWEPFWDDLDIPADEADPDDPENNARAVRIVFSHSPPDRGRALASIDELALVNWFERRDLSGGFSLEAPHAEDFLRVHAPAGDYVLDVTVVRTSLY
ncbi:MAG TPA: CapA family protein [Myxococcota bacterium]|nr:CapA family protein [Myxococcota bacterium]